MPVIANPLIAVAIHLPYTNYIGPRNKAKKIISNYYYFTFIFNFILMDRSTNISLTIVLLPA